MNNSHESKWESEIEENWQTKNLSQTQNKKHVKHKQTKQL